MQSFKQNVAFIEGTPMNIIIIIEKNKGNEEEEVHNWKCKGKPGLYGAKAGKTSKALYNT